MGHVTSARCCPILNLIGLSPYTMDWLRSLKTHDTILNGLISCAALCIFVAPVAAQDWSVGGVMRVLEIPAHEQLLAGITDPDTQLAPFETDGCSGGLSTSWRALAAQFPTFAQEYQSRPPWENCCVTHDRAYHHAGGAANPAASFQARLEADLALKSCVSAAHVDWGHDERTYERIAAAMYVAVRVGGGPCSGLPWRWGYGYPACSG